MRILTVVSTLAAATVLFGCSDAPSTVQGGELLLESPGSSSSGGGSGGSSGGGGSDGGATPSWSGLYLTIFSATSESACGSSPCHGTGGPGTSFWTCGPSSEACLQGLKAGESNMMLVPVTAGDQTTTPLYQALKRPNCSSSAPCNMPLQGTPLTSSQLSQIVAWLTAGAPDN